MQRRGRPSKKPRLGDTQTGDQNKGGQHHWNTGKNVKTYSTQVHTLSFPVTERDEETVECSTCHEKSSFRQFRIHNLTAHYNIATTTDDKDVINYWVNPGRSFVCSSCWKERRLYSSSYQKFYTRKLTEMGRLMKLSAFSCPNEGCDSRYKSALGLGYHLENCGKSITEIRASYITCEICSKKYASANINAHRKSHATPKPVPPALQIVENQKGLPKRSSALKAQKVLKTIAGRISTETDDMEADHDVTLDNLKQEVDDDDDEDEHDGSNLMKTEPTEDSCMTSLTAETGASATIPSTHEDISFHAHQSLSMELESSKNMWDVPQRFSANLFQDVAVNPLISFESDEIARSFLPTQLMSLEFRTKTRVPEQLPVIKNKVVQYNSTDFHQLKLFDSEITDSVYGNNIVFVGGPVSAMCWHPSGKYLAITTLKNYDDKPNINELEMNETCIQIYLNTFRIDSGVGSGVLNSYSGLTLQFLFGIENGFIHHMQWSSFWPLACESESVSQLFSDEDFIGHLAYAGGDSSISVIFVRKSYLDMAPNVIQSGEPDSRVIFYKKTPEISLQLHENSREEAGQCITFNWHEKFEYLAAGYAHGLVAVFNTQTTSRLLRKIRTEAENKSTTVVLHPFWYIRAHTEPVTVTLFNPANPRYLVTCSHDYFIKTWDVELRSEMEAKKVGMVLDSCWIRGWIHMAISTEYLNVNFQIGNYNVLKFYQVGSSKGYSNCADLFNITSVSFFEGMIAQATEVGRVTIVYYDQFLRECDYERNKKKKNTIDFSSISVEKSRIKGTDYTDAKLVFSLQNTKREVFGSIPEPTKDDAEDYVVFYNLVRINKIDWCPTGTQLATAYNNGFLVITPASFSNLYKNYR